jgi:hypothetical protein
MLDKFKKYTDGLKDIEMLFEHLENKEKADRRAEWLKSKSKGERDAQINAGRSLGPDGQGSGSQDTEGNKDVH